MYATQLYLLKLLVHKWRFQDHQFNKLLGSVDFWKTILSAEGKLVWMVRNNTGTINLLEHSLQSYELRKQKKKHILQDQGTVDQTD